MKPENRPRRPQFSSGPCAKRPGWSLANLEGALLGRSHRSAPARDRIREVSIRSRELLGIPDDYRVGIVPASDTGAFEMAMWSLLGQRGVDVLAWESFSAGWQSDIEKQLAVQDVRALTAEYGRLPDLAGVDFDRDVVFVWNGTTSGVRVPDGDWIPDDREGLTLCDATSAVFAMDVPFDKLDVVTWSWQKALGGEAAHGMLALSPRAVARLEAYAPPRPLPKIFRLTKGGKLIDGIFDGATINTPSLLAVEDVLDALAWANDIGGLSELIRRSEANLAATTQWVEATDWVDFLCADPALRSCTSICLQIVDPWFSEQAAKAQSALVKRMGAMLDGEGVAHDVGSYKDAPPGLRVWGGATVESSDLEALFPWLDWAWTEVRGAES
jgi:phosphoserine aminotransferase